MNKFLFLTMIFSMFLAVSCSHHGHSGSHHGEKACCTKGEKKACCKKGEEKACCTKAKKEGRACEAEGCAKSQDA